MITGFEVLKIVLMPSRQRLASLANSGPRWSMIGVSIARSTRSGSGVGPGICRKWRPTGREEFFDIGKSLRSTDFRDSSARPGAGPQLAAMKDECDSQSSLLAAFRHDRTNGQNVAAGIGTAAQGKAPG